MPYIPYVNIKQGTRSQPRFSCGNTLPMTQLPFAMAGFAPQTQAARGNWFYHPGDHSLEGVRLTHQPSPWVGDYGHFVLMPQAGPLRAEESTRWSGFRPEEAVLRPDYLNLYFQRYRARFELAPTDRGAAVRVSYDRPGPARFAVLPAAGSCGFRVDVEKRRLTGWTDAHTWKMPANFRTYFVMDFDCDLVAEETFLSRPRDLFEQATAGEGEGVGIFVGLSGREVNVRLAISYISEEQAVRNLERELSGRSFDELQQAAADVWEAHLSKIQVETETEEQKRTFYSCLYRLFLYPHKFYELDEAGRPMHYDSYHGDVKPGVLYTDNGFWDTFRTVYPMLAVIAPDAYAEILEGYVNIYKDSGWMPKWPSGSETGIMPGTLVDAVVAEAVVRGIGDRRLWEDAFEGLLKHASVEAEDERFGRQGTGDYKKYGYIPRGGKYKECVNHTLDYVYGDFCISQVAKALGREDLAAQFAASAQNYKKLFDPATGFMRGRDENGGMAPGFDPFGWGGEYTEGGPWQNSFAVYHDVEGLAALYGGRENLIAKLDELFSTPPLYAEGGYGFEIHEMTEMAAADFGQCAISNQPSFHIPYLYAALGAQEKTDAWVRRLAEAFSSGDDGFPGDEDNGTMSAWYLFSSLGFYPLCPGKAEYVPGPRLVKDAKILGRRYRLENGGLIFE